MKFFSTLIKFILFVIIIFVLIHYKFIEIPSIEIFSKSYTDIIIICFLIFINIVINSYKWWLLLISFRYNISFSITYLIYSVGIFFNNIMPGGIGGDIVKGTYLFKFIKANQRTKSLLTIITDRIIGLHSLISISLASGIYLLNTNILSEELTYIINSLLAITFVILLFIGSTVFYANNVKKFVYNNLNAKINKLKKIKEIIIKILSALEEYNDKKLLILKCWLIAITNHMIFIYCFLIMARILSVEFENFEIITFVTSSSIIANSIPITPGGIGVGEGTFDFLFSSIADNTGIISNIAYGSIFFLTFRVIYVITSLIIGGLSFIILKKPLNKIEISQ